MKLTNLRQRMRRVFRTRAGQALLALFVAALLVSSLPDLQWHSHLDGEVAHVHPVHASGMDSIDHHDDGNEPDANNFHLHDGNHCSAAPMTLHPAGVEQIAHRDRALRVDAAAPASTTLIPPYRPPIV
jgi:hypothetical protein